MSHFRWVCIVTCCWLWSACGSQQAEIPLKAAFPPTFTMIRNRIFIPRCVVCHSGIVSHKVLLTSQSDQNQKFLVPGNAANSRLYTSLVSGKMPQYGQKLTDAELTAVREWITAGALDD